MSIRLLVAAYLIIAIIGLMNYVNPFSINFLLGLLTLMLAFSVEKKGLRSYRLLFPLILIIIVYWLLPVKTVLFIVWSTAFLFLIETMWGRLSYLPFLTIGLISPFANYLFNVFSFPVRLEITAISGKLMQWIGMEVRTEGNTISLNNSSFIVDAACMGLYMLTASVISGCFLLALVKKKTGKLLPFKYALLLIVAVISMNILTNLLRICMLVYFNVPPEKSMHHVLGLLFFLLYTLVPTYFLTQYFIRKWGKMDVLPNKLPNFTAKNRLVILNVCFCIIVCLYSLGFGAQHYPVFQFKQITLPGYEITQQKGDVLKLNNANELIYIKPIYSFFATDHHPMICWKGSGYLFSKVQEKQIDEINVYFAVLQKGSETLYTTWWYQNEQVQTTSQLTWRWEMANNAQPFSLINITASTINDLENSIIKFNQLKIYSKLQ